MKRYPIYLTALLTTALIPVGTVSAAPYTWTGGATGNWNVDGNWDTAGFPDGTDDTAAITTAATVDLNGAQVSSQLTISAGNIVTLNNSGAGALSLGGVVDGPSSFIRSTGASSTTVNAPITITRRSTGAGNANFAVAGSGNLTFSNTVDMTAVLGVASQNFVSIATGSTAKVEFTNVVNYGNISNTNQYLTPGDGEIWFSGNNTNMSSPSNRGFFIKPGNTTGVTGVGTVVLDHNNALGSAWITFGESDIAQANSRTVRLALATEGLSVGNNIRMRGEGSGMAVGGIHTSGVATYTGGIVIQGNATASINPSRFFSENSAATTRFSGLISGGGTALIQGNGTVEFSGAAGNTYTGNTTVSSGTLLVNNTSGSGTGTGTVTVDSGATLGGSGIISGATTINGTHSPGNSPGLQTFSSNLTYNDATVVWELTSNSTAGRGTTYDGINVGGNLTFTGTSALALTFNGIGSTVDWTDSMWNSSITGTNGWLIYDVAGSLTGTLATTTANWVDSQGNLFNTVLAGSSFSTFQSGSDLYLNYSVIPEPSTWALLAGSLISLIVFRRMRRRA